MTDADLVLLDSLITRVDEYLVPTDDLPAGLSESQIVEQEERLGWRLPAELRHFYSRHDGYFLMPYTPPYPLAQAVEITLFNRAQLRPIWREQAPDCGVDPDMVWPDSLLEFSAHAPVPVFVDCAVPWGHASVVFSLDDDLEHRQRTASFADLLWVWLLKLDAGHTVFTRERGWEWHDDRLPAEVPIGDSQL